MSKCFVTSRFKSKLELRDSCWLIDSEITYGYYTGERTSQSNQSNQWEGKRDGSKEGRQEGGRKVGKEKER